MTNSTRQSPDPMTATILGIGMLEGKWLGLHTPEQGLQPYQNVLPDAGMVHE